ncbi:MAG TPA: hypothetical protein VHL58_15185 [Thermoanaerobaculia bacterium]|nr:hypothetical protein [Thermoanaerobaculia bacterium]
MPAFQPAARAALLVTVALLGTSLLSAQTTVTVEVAEVMDNRMSAGMLTGSLDIQAELKGPALEKASAARIIVKEARDDRGTDLTPSRVPDFQGREYNSGRLSLSLKNPPRQATSVRLKGLVELFVPSNDPNAVIRVEKALSKLDAPLASARLKTAKITITPLSPSGYAAEMKKQKVTDKDIEELRAKAKASGADPKEVEFAIGLAKALGEIDNQPLPENAIVLACSSKDMERIQKIEIIGTDGKPLDVGSRQSSSHGDSAIVILQPNSAPPPGAALEFTLLTDKSRISVPFELKKVVLP